MRSLPGFSSLPLSRCTRILLLAALCALFMVAPGMAQASTAAAAPAPANVETAQFLASLAAPSSAPADLMPSPMPASGCTSSAQCPPGQLCCLACGFAGCERRACFVPMNGHCPFFP